MVMVVAVVMVAVEMMVVMVGDDGDDSLRRAKYLHNCDLIGSSK